MKSVTRYSLTCLVSSSDSFTLLMSLAAWFHYTLILLVPKNYSA